MNAPDFRRRLSWALETWAVDHLYLRPFARLSVEAASDRGAALLAAIGPRLSAHRVACANIAAAFPGLSRRAVEDLARQGWREIGRTIGEFPHLPKMKVFAPGSRYEVVGAERLAQLRIAGQSAVFFSGHLGNWEAMAAALCQSGLDCVVTYRRINNPFVDQRVSAIRRGYGVQFLSAKSRMSLRGLIGALQAGRSFTILNDQKYDEGIAVPFFGRPAATAPSALQVAHKYRVPLIPVSNIRTGPGRYRVTVHEPLRLPDRLDADGLMAGLSAINAFIEARARECPAQYFWVHRRWPRGS